MYHPLSISIPLTQLLKILQATIFLVLAITRNQNLQMSNLLLDWPLALQTIQTLRQ